MSKKTDGDDFIITGREAVQVSSMSWSCHKLMTEESYMLNDNDVIRKCHRKKPPALGFKAKMTAPSCLA